MSKHREIFLVIVGVIVFILTIGNVWIRVKGAISHEIIEVSNENSSD